MAGFGSGVSQWQRSEFLVSILVWLIREEKKDRGSRTLRMWHAVVPDDKRGWRAVVAASSQRCMTVENERELAAVQNRLRLKYQLRS